MLNKTFKFLVIILCLCFTTVYSAMWTDSEPWVSPATHVDDGKPYIEFTCTAYLLAGEILLWGHNKRKSGLGGVKLNGHHYRGFVTTTLFWPLDQTDVDLKIFCVKKSNAFIENGEKEYQFTTSVYISIDFQKDNVPLERSRVPQVMPTAFVDDGQPYIEFTCWSFSTLKWQVLSWFQVKESNITERLAIMKHDAYIDDYKKITLRKTLEASDKGSEIYCASEIMIEGGRFITKNVTKRIPLNFDRHIEPLKKPHVSIEPDTDTVMFEEHEVLAFVCGGGAPADGRGYTWHLQGSNLHSFAPPGQRYDKFSNLSRLYLRMEVYYHGSQLYCAQTYTLKSSPFHGELIALSFRELARSRLITLLHRDHVRPGATKWSKNEPWVTPVTYVDDGKPFAKFTCAAYVGIDEYLAWFNGTEEVKLTYLKQSRNYNGYRTLHLLVPLDKTTNGAKVFCGRQHSPYYDDGKKMYKLDKSEIITIDFQRNNVPSEKKLDLQMTPQNYVDDGKPYIEFTCWAYLQQWQTLSWLQIKDSNHSDRLAMVQQEAKNGYTKIELLKTLKLSDKDTEIYCAKEKVLLDGTYQAEKETKRIPLKFDRHIEPLEPPSVTVTPIAEVVLFDDGEELDFICGGSAPVDGRGLTWYSEGPHQRQVLPVVQRYDKIRNQNHLKLRMVGPYHGSKFYCAQDFTLKTSPVYGEQITTSYGELARSRMITVLHRNQDNPGDEPMVTPRNFIEENKPFIEFTCYAFLKNGELLSWYQSKGSKITLLRMVQLEEPKYEGGQWVALPLNKTLEQSDRGSAIYCAQQSVLSNGSFSEKLQSEEVGLKFKRNIPLLVPPHVFIKPNTNNVYFDINTTLRFTCSGSVPVDGRTYTWIRMDSDSRLTVPDDQKYDASTNLNVLHLSVSETYHQSQLYCAQGFLSFIHHTDGSLRSKIYGELAKSDMITLMLPEKARPQVSPEKFEDKNKSCIQFSCFAFLQAGELLSWYQSKGSPRSEKILLKILQNSKHGRWVELTLKKTLEQSDRDSELYCVKQSVLPDGRFSDGLESRRVALTFTRDIPPLELPHVYVEPNTSVHYVVDTTLHFTCGGSLPVDDRAYTWFRIDSDFNVIIPEGQKYEASSNLNVLELSLGETYHHNRLYCAQGSLAYIRHTDGSLRTKFYGELSKSDMITLILLVRDGKPQIYPEQFTDDLKSSTQFTCYAFLRVGELMSWYQSKGKGRSDNILLRMIQLQKAAPEDGQWMELSLSKTLEQSDRDSELYCVKQSVLPDGSFSDGPKSRRVPLTLHRRIPATERPYVIIEPASSVHFDVHPAQPDRATVLRFTCSGSSPVDGRTYTWFRIDSSSNVIVPTDQKYDASTNRNVLYLSPSETYHQSQLYCAQGFLSDMRHTDGSLRTKFYGELAKSGTVLLVMREKVAVEPWVTVLSVALPLALAALAAVLAALAAAGPEPHAAGH